mmetsp:Transcript_15096/g.23020  ORF Transcript_15096/g.23020 Transcript_15096/m.23020 type:complete len:325 (-) Transcript_15096:327-1301(-)
MALLRRGSSNISNENINMRLEREQAKTGAITVSLAWNDPSDLDLHAYVHTCKGNNDHIFYSNKKAAGGVLDVDMHASGGAIVDEPVENIYWAEPPAGEYRVEVKLFKLRAGSNPKRRIPFKLLLQREGEETLSVEAYVANASYLEKQVSCFRWVVTDDDCVTIQERVPRFTKAKSNRPRLVLSTPPAARTVRAKGKGKGKSAARAVAPAAMKVKKLKLKAKAKGKGKVKASKPMKESKIAKGKKAKELVWKGLKDKTYTGLKKEHLVRNKFGKVVSAKKSAAAKTNKWAIATSRARKELGFSGFRPLRKGDEFYVKAKEILATL